MNTVISIFIQSMSLVVCLFCGWLMWHHRREVDDRSRTILAVICLACSLLLVKRLVDYMVMPGITPYYHILSPFQLYGGLGVLTTYMLYPIEVLRPRWLRGRRTLLLFTPLMLACVFPLAGLRFQTVESFSDIITHLSDFDVLFRLIMAAAIAVMAMLLLLIPYNWRETSADHRWIQRMTFIAFVTCMLLYGQLFTRQPIFHFLHLVWFCLSIIYFTYFELRERLQPVELPNNIGGGGQSSVPKGDLWQQISYLMDIKEYWRNPDTSVETISKAIGTNRIYVARIIKDHTGMSFNDYMNSRRVEYMATMLRQNSEINQKTLFFAAGFRSYPTAHRNFTKFKGCSPTDYITKR